MLTYLNVVQTNINKVHNKNANIFELYCRSHIYITLSNYLHKSDWSLILG